MEAPRFSIHSLRAISNKGTPKDILGMYYASVSTHSLGKGPSSLCSPSPSLPSSCFQICPPEFINGLSREKAFHQQCHLLRKAAWRIEVRFPMLLTYFNGSSLKFLRSGNTVPILQQWSLGSWPAWWVGLSGITALALECQLSFLLLSTQSRWVPAGSTAGHSCPPCPCTGDHRALADPDQRCGVIISAILHIISQALPSGVWWDGISAPL